MTLTRIYFRIPGMTDQELHTTTYAGTDDEVFKKWCNFAEDLENESGYEAVFVKTEVIS